MVFDSLDSPQTREYLSHFAANPDKPLRGTSLARKTYEQLLALGAAEVNERFDNIRAAEAAMQQMPNGLNGIVLGSGENTADWRKRGWDTMDLQAEYQADLTGHAEALSSIDATHKGQRDYVLAENISFEPAGIEGIDTKALIRAMNQALKTGGIGVIRTVDVIGGRDKEHNTIPGHLEFIALLQQQGFDVVSVVEEPEPNTLNNGDDSITRVITYYGEKKAESTYKEPSPGFMRVDLTGRIPA